MTTMHRPVLAITDAVALSLKAHRGLRATVLTCTPRFRIFKGLRFVAKLVPYRHPRLSAMLRYRWHFTRAHSSWSRA